MSEQHSTILTIGHSTHTFETFVRLLQSHRVTALADVRSTPFSRFNPQFDRTYLERNLKLQNIKYVFLGLELGARPEDKSCYENGQLQYVRLARTPKFRSGIERILKGAAVHQIAMMCAEKDPLECHRTILISPALIDAGLTVSHILADGRLESHNITMDRLLQVSRLPQQDLFRSRSELLSEALSRQAHRIAYRPE